MIALIAFLALSANAFHVSRVVTSRQGLQMVSTDKRALSIIEAPDFYWQYRLERIALKRPGDFSFKSSNYPEAKTPKELYDAYYLDLVLQGKLNGFDWVAEKKLTDSEWLAIYKSMCQWTAKTVRQNKPGTANLPKNDFDLLKQFYPQLSFRELEVSFTPEEVGSNFPYKNMKELLSAAVSGKLNIPDTADGASLEAGEIRKEVVALKEKTLKKVDEIYQDAIAFAKTPFPDEESKVHYQKLRSELATYPITPSEWATYRSDFEKTVDEMATLAAKLDDKEHHEHHDESEVSPAQEFEMKYGKNLDLMQDLMSKYKQNPESFYETSVLDKYGKAGLEILSKSQEFSEKLSVMSEEEKQAAEKVFKDFLQKA